MPKGFTIDVQIGRIDESEGIKILQTIFIVKHDDFDEPLIEPVDSQGQDETEAAKMAVDIFCGGVWHPLDQSMTKKNPQYVSVDFLRQHYEFDMYCQSVVRVGVKDKAPTMLVNFLRTEIPKYLGSKKYYWLRIYLAKYKEKKIIEVRINGSVCVELPKYFEEYVEKEMHAEETFVSEKQYAIFVQREEDKCPFKKDIVMSAARETISMMEKINNHEEYVIPSYHMLKMFATNRGSYVCEHTLMTESDRRSEHGFFRTPDGDIVEGTSLIYDTDMNDIRIRFWDRGKEGEDQNHYDWILENGTSKVIHYNGWSAETICNETEFTMPDGIRHVEMTASEDSFRITLNGITVHEHTLAPIPHLTAVTTFDENSNTVITKLVNFSENEIELTLSYSTDMAQTAEMTVLTAESRFAHNSFDTPGAVAPYTVTIPSSRNQVLPIRAHSVNVIMQKLFGYCSEEY
jgi:hypothetical protein